MTQQTSEWEKELQLLISGTLPYWESEDRDRYVYISEPKDIIKLFGKLKDFTQDRLSQQRKEILGEVNKLVVDEILICHQENTPTSRLTSLANKLKDLEK